MFLQSLRTFFIILSFALPYLISFAHTFVLKPSVSQALAKVLIGNILIQTEAERRRREAGVQQSIENGLGSCMYVYMFVWFPQISGDLKHRACPKWCHTMAT